MIKIPESITGFIFILGSVFAAAAYFIRINKVRNKLGISFPELYDEKYKEDVKNGLKGLTRIQIFWIIFFLILSILTAVINKQ